MGKPFLSPLNYQVRIADAQGRPTPEFQMKWRKLFQIAGTIPDVSSAAAMSLLLDKVAGAEGAILRRGASAWAGLASPGGTTTFLRADGTYATPPQQTVDESEISLSDLLTNNVSSSRHGFTPKLPGDATKYLDGTGAYSVPAGGSGGGGGKFWALPGMSFAGSNTTGYATLGNLVLLSEDVSIDALSMAWLAASGGTYSMFVATIDSSRKILSTLVTAASRFTASAAGATSHVFDLPAKTTLAKNTAYLVAGVRTDSTVNANASLYYASTVTGYNSVPFDIGGAIGAYSSTVNRIWYANNSDSPSNVSASSDNSSGQYGIGFRVVQ